MLVIENVKAVDSEEERDGPVAVENGEIVSVGDTPDGSETVVDGRGGVVAPGLIDSHVHISMDGRPDSEGVESESNVTLAYRAAEHLGEAVQAGVTTVRDLGSPGRLGPDTRDAIAEGYIEGPRVVPCGSAVVITGGHGYWMGQEADGPTEVRKTVREQLKKGAEVVKTMATGGVLTEGAEIGGFEMSPEELDALVETASAKDRPTAAHCHAVSGIKNATRAGISSIEHGTFMDREAAELMVEEGTYWVPTASALRGITENGTDAGIPEWAVSKAEKAETAFEDAWIHALDTGVPIAMGTDAGTPFNFHRNAAHELEYMVDYGLSAEHAFEAATTNAADLLGLDEVGRIESGYRADLVVLDSDPREDVSAYTDPQTVVANGNLVYDSPN